MKKQLQFIIVTVFALVGLNSNANAQAFNCFWAQASDQSNSNSTTSLLNDVYAMATDGAGNTYITGTFNTDTIVFGSFTLLRAAVSKTNSDFFIVKYNSSGSVVWAKSAGGNGANGEGSSEAGFDNIASGTGVAIDNAGNVYVTGYFQSDSVVFGNYTLSTLNGTAANTSNIFIVKYDPSGNVIWAKEAGETEYDITSAAITVDTKANVYITGIYGLTSLVSSATIDNITLAGNGYLLAKYDSSGNIKWAKTASGDLASYYSSCGGSGIKSDANGNVFVTGTFFGDSTAFGNGVTLHNSLGGVNSLMFVVKYDSSGNALWAQSANIGIKGQGFNGETIGGVNGISTDVKGNLYVTGGFYSATVTFGSTTLTNTAIGGFDNMFIVKYSPSGNVRWAQSATETPNDFIAEGLDVATDAGGNVFVTGTFDDDTIHLGSIALLGTSAQNFYVAEYDSSGNVLGAMAASGGGYQIDEGVCVTTDDNGSIYVTGIFSDTLAFGNTKMFSGPQQGVYVAKFNGTPTGIKQVAVNSNQLSIYPNPSNGNFIVHLQNINSTAQLQIFNVLGQTVYEENLNSTITQLNLSDVPKGIYLYKVSTNDGQFVSSGKFVIE